MAVATCAVPNVDPDQPLLLDELARAGVEARALAWDDPSACWDDFDLVVVRSTWDYAPRRARFLDWARGRARVANPVAALEYSSDKHYLADLAARGVPVVPTAFYDVGAALGDVSGDVVVKPAVGAGSFDAARHRAGEGDAARAHVARLHTLGRDAMVQPYLDSVDDLGEHALVFVDGELTHAMTKSALLNTPEPERTRAFRAGAVSPAEPEPKAVEVARAALEPFDDLLYARVDLVRDAGAWAVLELELVEPSLFLTHHPPAARRLAEAIARR
ncbi:MAG TPA: hypothetical protein VGS61_04015 [Acidimicrobiales bacterium]|nr:hypothetical protein [Acidimicrobiales bacterium]